MFTCSFLQALRGKALRRKQWFKALNNFERSFYNLTCSIIDRVESLDLGREILELVLKLKNALKGEFVRLVESIGVRKAWEAAKLAIAWGYTCAKLWKYDLSLIRLLTLNEINHPSGWGLG